MRAAMAGGYETPRYIFFVVASLLGAGHQVLAQQCTGLCLQQVACPGGGTTSVSGTVFAPNGADPLPNVLVYVPNGGPAPNYGVQPFPPGVQTSAPVTGSPLVQTTTSFNGTFSLTNMPVGTNIPLVMQASKWRRLYTIGNVSACTNTALPTNGALQTRLPTKESEFSSADSIPRIAIVTGSVDALECSLRKIGISDSEFSNPAAQGGTGHINLYLGRVAAGAQYSTNTPSETQLFGTQTMLNAYDITMLPCQGSADTPTAIEDAILVGFANSGGRVFATHSSYTWLSNFAPFSGTANWMPNQSPPATDPQTANVNTNFPAGQQLARWLQIVNASTTFGQIPLSSLKEDLNGLVAPTQSWLTIDSPLSTMQFTFDTPVGSPTVNQYGFVQYDDYHIVSAVGSPTTGLTFPSECTSSLMTPQERLLEFDLFALPWMRDEIFYNGFQ